LNVKKDRMRFAPTCVTNARSYQRRLTVISVQHIFHFLLILRTRRKRWRVSWTESKVNVRW